MTVNVISENKDRTPLHASATSKRALGSRIMLPSRTAETPAVARRKLAVLDARICSGNVSCSTTVDEGIIRIRNARGNEITARCFHPAKKTTIPQIKSRIEMRERKNAELIVPRTSASSADRRIIRPDHDGFTRSAASLARPSQSKNSENTGTKKP